MLFFLAFGCLTELGSASQCDLNVLRPQDQVIFYDGDGDSFLNFEEYDCATTPDAGTSWVAVLVADIDGMKWDCDDTDPAVTVELSWYADSDSDNYGDPFTVVSACTQPGGYVLDATDCDDARADYHPNATEDDCTDPNDYNCDGSVGFEDADGDGVAACEDCDDDDAGVYPNADEDCSDVDRNCDGDPIAGATDESTWFLDSDSDDYGDSDLSTRACDQPEGYVEYGGDCDDADERYHPGAEESDCTDPNDYNCDGSVGFEDKDGDGFAACEECDDSSAEVKPGGDEVCNGVDDDCDSKIDDNDDSLDTSTGTEFYADADSDSFGDAANTTWACDQPSSYVTDATDCDDSAAATYPGADEYCDGVDTDCDGTLDEDDALDADTWNIDSDGDGYGDSGTTTDACDQPSGYAADATDCDDSDADTYPGIATNEDPSTDCMTDSDGDGYGSDSPATGVTAGTDCDDSTTDVNPEADEYCSDGTDSNCDGDDDTDAVDGNTYFADSDGDGYGDASSYVLNCDSSAPSGYSTDDTDCNDSDVDVNPGATETLLIADENCDGLPYPDTDGDGVDDYLGVTVTGANVIDEESATFTDSSGAASLGSWDVYYSSTGTTSSSLSPRSYTWAITDFSTTSNVLDVLTGGASVTDECVYVPTSTSSGDDYICTAVFWNSGTAGNEACIYQNTTSTQLDCYTFDTNERSLVVLADFTAGNSDDLLICTGGLAGGAVFTEIGCFPY